MKVLVVDDEKWSRDEMSFILSSIEDVEVVGEAKSAHEAAIIMMKSQPDACFLDINMPGISGIEFAEQLKGMPNEPFIVFVTAYANKAATAFRLEALDYIVKPFGEEAVEEAIGRLRRRLELLENKSPQPIGKLTVQGAESLFFLDPADIDFVRREDRFSVVVSKGVLYTTTVSLKELEEKLVPHAFVRVHKSYLINALYAHSLTALGNSVYELTLSTSKEVIPVSRTYLKNLKNVIDF